MDYLSMLRSADAEKTLPRPTAKTAISPFGSKGSPLEVRISANDENAAEVDPEIEARREQVVAMLNAHPEWRYAVVTDTDAEPGAVVVHIGIRGIGSGEIVTAKSRYDGIDLVRALENRKAIAG